MNDHVDRARAALRLRRWDIALQSLAAALADDPGDPEAQALRAEALYRQHRYLEAQAAAREAIEAAPNWGMGYFWLGWSTLSNGLLEPPQIRQASQAAEEALRCGPDDPNYWALLAQVTLVEGNTTQAASHAETGLTHDPDHEGCLEALATAHQGSTLRKQRILLRLVELNPESVFVHRHLAETALAANEPHAALEHARTAIQLDPLDDGALEAYHEAVRGQHPVIRFLSWSSTPWRRYPWFPVLGGIPMLLLILIRGHSVDKDGDLWFWGAFCFFATFLLYGIATIVFTELIASHSRRLSELLPEAAQTRRRFYWAAGFVILLAMSIAAAVWWQGPLPVIAFYLGGTIIILVRWALAAKFTLVRVGLGVLAVVAATAFAVAVSFDCQPNPVVWSIGTVVVTALIWAAALRLTGSD